MAITEQTTDTRLSRGISGPLLYLFILGDVLGAGVYALVGVISGKVGGAIWVPLMVALALALLTAGSYAELVTKYPRAGGAAIFAERAFKKPLVAFLVGFSMLAAGVTSAAGLALAFAGDYLGTFLDVPAVPAAIVFLALVALLNARGISESLKTNLVMTVVEVSGLLIVIVTVAVLLGRGGGDVARVTEFPAGVSPAASVASRGPSRYDVSPGSCSTAPSRASVASSRAAVCACAIPVSFSGMSLVPCSFPSRLKSVWPWRTRAISMVRA